MKIKLKTIEECNALIAKANILLGYPNYENGTLTYTDVPELTEILDEEENVIESYYEIEVSPEMHEQMISMATKELVEDTATTDFEPGKRFEVKATDAAYLEMLKAVPELGMYRKQANLTIYQDKGYQLFYTDEFLPNHREILEQYLGVNSITDRLK